MLAARAHGAAGEIAGPLVRSETNPRYFADANGEIVYLTGSHTWNTLVDMDDTFPPRRFDFAAWLDFVVAQNHNFVRLFTWEVPNPQSREYERRIFAAPLPWLRTGPGTDSAGLPRFDLSKPNPEYYSRLRERVAMAREKGVYVSVMLFEGWAVQFAPGRGSHPFLGGNNVNGIDAGDPKTIHTLLHSEITKIQEAHLREVVDTVNEFDNVLYEIVNEAGAYSTAWQKHMIEYLRNYEAGKPRQHPIGMTYQYEGGLNETLLDSDADWISPGPESGRYRDDPRPGDGTKVIIADTDHLGGSATGNRKWVWKSFTRGLNPVFMDRYEPPDSIADEPYKAARDVRAAMGLTRLMAQRVDMASMVPRPELASSGFALAGPQALIVYQPYRRPEYVDLRHVSGELAVEWFDPKTGDLAFGEPVAGGSNVYLVRPRFQDDVVIYLYQRGSDSMGPAEFGARAKAIIEASYRLDRTAGLPAWPRRIGDYLGNELAHHGAGAAAVLLLIGFVGGVSLSVGAVALYRKRRRSSSARTAGALPTSPKPSGERR